MSALGLLSPHAGSNNTISSGKTRSAGGRKEASTAIGQETISAYGADTLNPHYQTLSIMLVLIDTLTHTRVCDCGGAIMKLASQYLQPNAQIYTVRQPLGCLFTSTNDTYFPHVCLAELAWILRFLDDLLIWYLA